MKFQVGDKVLVLHSNEEGEVVDIINDKMVMVDVRGVKFPAYADQLDFPYFKKFSGKKIVEPARPKTYIDDIKKEKKPAPPAYLPGVSVMFIPKFETDEFGDEVVEQLKVYLINGTEAGYHFQYQLAYFGKTEFELKNELLARKDFYLHDIPFSDLNDSPVFAVEFSLISPDKRKAPYYETTLKLKPQQLFKKIEEIKQQGLPSFSYKLFDHYPDKTEEPVFDTAKLAAVGYRVYDASKARQHLPPARSVVDLHIEKLADDWEQMDRFGILTLQIKTFEQYFELAVAHHLSSIIFIHGLGSGRLRDELHEHLRLKKEVRSFVNQYHPLYGYGATEVFLQYK